MGMIASNTLVSALPCRNEKIQPNEIGDVGGVQRFDRPGSAVQAIPKSKNMAEVVQLDRSESFRIKALEKELSHFRGMFDKMVRQRTEMLERRLSIMESCNSTLNDNYHKMHQMYVDLANKTQSYEAEMYQRTLESELHVADCLGAGAVPMPGKSQMQSPGGVGLKF